MPPEIDPSEYDIDALVKEVGEGLFPKEPEVEPKEPSAASTGNEPALQTPAEKTPPQIDPVAQLAALDASHPLPKSWPKDSAAEWKGMTEAQRGRAIAREADISRGIQTYQQGYSNWDAVTKPFAEVFKAHPQVNPAQLYTNLMDSHLVLMGMKGPEAKAAKARELLSAYGITLEGLNAAPASPPPAPLPPQLLSRIDGVEAYVLAQQERAVDAFFNDPKNEFANDVAPDIQRLLETGQAKDLQSAYEQALWLNPATREKLLAKQIAERDAKAKEAADKVRRLNNLNRGKSSSELTEPAPRKGSIDETVDAVVAKHYPSH